MNDREAIQKSLEHWERMRECVAGMPENANILVYKHDMFNEIGETTGAHDCALCQKYFDSTCDDCPLRLEDDWCTHASTFDKAACSETAGEFVENAGAMITQLRRLLYKCDADGHFVP